MSLRPFNTAPRIQPLKISGVPGHSRGVETVGRKGVVLQPENYRDTESRLRGILCTGHRMARDLHPSWLIAQYHSVLVSIHAGFHLETQIE